MTKAQAGVIIILLLAIMFMLILILLEIDDLQTTLRLVDVACPAP